MPGTHSQILLHLVFSTKDRVSWITDAYAERIYGYIGGIVRAEGGMLYAIGGSGDHVHMYVRWKTDGAVADLMRTVKSRSTKWVRSDLGVREFAWQDGYAVFSVSKSQEGAVRAYIAKQREHHARTGFGDELRRLLRAHEVEFDARFVD